MNIFVFGSFLFQIFFGPSIPLQPELTVELRTQTGAHFFSVEVANDDQERARGLMSRLYLAENHGMLFVYDDERIRSFWMKNTLIPLDMIFFDHEKRVIDIKKSILPCKTDFCPLYTSKKPAMYVLELHAGTADVISLSTSDRLY